LRHLFILFSFLGKIFSNKKFDKFQVLIIILIVYDRLFYFFRKTKWIKRTSLSLSQEDVNLLQDKIKELWNEQKQKLNEFLSQELNLENIITEDWIDFDKIQNVPIYEFLWKIQESDISINLVWVSTKILRWMDRLVWFEEYDKIKNNPDLTSDELESIYSKTMIFWYFWDNWIEYPIENRHKYTINIEDQEDYKKFLIIEKHYNELLKKEWKQTYLEKLTSKNT